MRPHTTPRWQWCGAIEPHDRHEHLVGVRMFDCRGVPGCTGSSECQAEEHIHGCWADTGNCDEPGEHVEPAYEHAALPKLARKIHNLEADRDRF